MHNREQERSSFALKRINLLPTVEKETSSFVSGVPAMILQNGFGQALAFLRAKGKGEGHHGAAFSIMKKWLTKNKLVLDGNDRKFLVNISEMDQTEYLEAQTETLAMLEWLKRYANAKLF